MAKTRGKLEAAKIYDADEPGDPIYCMFNPYEYSVKKNNDYNETPKNEYDAPVGNFTKA